MYPAPPIAPTSATADARQGQLKRLRRAVDAMLANEKLERAERALSLARTLASNTLQHPREAKYTRFKSTNATLKRDLLSVHSAAELVRALGFATVVEQMEEFWQVEIDEHTEASLTDAVDAIDNYLDSVARKLDEARRRRSELLAGTSKEREATLALIEADREERREKLERKRLARECQTQAALDDPDLLAALAMSESATSPVDEAGAE